MAAVRMKLAGIEGVGSGAGLGGSHSKLGSSIEVTPRLTSCLAAPHVHLIRKEQVHMMACVLAGIKERCECTIASSNTYTVDDSETW
jgi:hypothetical protein